MIKLLRGFYDNGAIMTPEDGPFGIEDNKYRTGAEREAQLVASGMAVFVGDEAEEPVATSEEVPEETPEEAEDMVVPAENPEEESEAAAEEKKEAKKRTRR